MKKVCMYVSVLFFVALAGAFAEQADLYARTIPLDKVYPHELGYKVLYMSKLKYVEAYLPHKWFSQSSTQDGQMTKGELVWGNDPSYPYMIVFWKAGKFDHVRVYLKKNMADLSYGAINPNEDASKFDVDELVLQF